MQKISNEEGQKWDGIARRLKSGRRECGDNLVSERKVRTDMAGEDEERRVK